MLWILALVILAALLLMMVVFFWVLSGSKDNYQVNRGEDRVNGSLREPATIRARGMAEPPAMATPVRIDDAAINDRIRITGGADNQMDLEFRIAGKVQYQSDRENWHEYYGQCRGRRMCVEVFQGGDQVGVVLPDQALTLGSVGLTEDELIRWDEGNDAGEPFSYDGALWKFEWSGEVSYSEDDGSHQDGYYGWDFLERGGQRILCVEKREGEPFEVCMVHLIGVDQVRVTHS